MDYNKPCSFLNHTNQHTRAYEGFSTGLHWILFVYVSMCVCLPFGLSVCMGVSASVLRPSIALSPYTPLHRASKKQREQQSAVVDSNRAYKQRYKSSLRASNSIQLRFGLSHVHLTQVRHDEQPQTILAVKVTATV